MSRPEDQLPPEMFYSTNESEKYTASTRIQTIQAQMTHRALALLNLSTPSLILDIGCGSGLSGSILAQEAPPMGPHTWIGVDISPAMLAVALTRPAGPSPLQQQQSAAAANEEGEGEEQEEPLAADAGDLFLADMGQGLAFRPGTFDAAISISAIQWLCAAPSTEDSAAPELRLRRFFADLYACLRRGARAVCQFYPKDAIQREMICAAAIRAGFGAGVLEDGVGTKNEKLYLVLTVGEASDITRVVGGFDNVHVQDARRKGAMPAKHAKGVKGSRGWILMKKERMARQGKVVKQTSKYTGRSRGPKF